MAEFRKPSNGKMSKMGNGSLQFESYPMDKIYSPYDGRVISVSFSSCGGNVQIEHSFRGSTLISNLCEVSTIFVARGDRVSSGQVIGKLGGNILEYSLEDQRGNKVNPSVYFGSSDTEPKQERKKSETKKKQEYTNRKSKSDSSSSFELTPGLTVAHQVFADMLGAPLNIFKGKNFFKPGKLFKENIDSNQKLTEEIERIKSLLK